MELEFLNTEPDFDCSWLPADIEQPECIASENAQVALDVFCKEVRDFLLINALSMKLRSIQLSSRDSLFTDSTAGYTTRLCRLKTCC